MGPLSGSLYARPAGHAASLARFRTFSDSPNARARLNGNLELDFLRRRTRDDRRRLGATQSVSRADSANVCYHPSSGRPKSVPDTVFPRVRRFGCSSSCCWELWNLGLLILLCCPESNKLPQLFDLIWLSGDGVLGLIPPKSNVITVAREAELGTWLLILLQGLPAAILFMCPTVEFGLRRTP